MHGTRTGTQIQDLRVKASSELNDLRPENDNKLIAAKKGTIYVLMTYIGSVLRSY